MNDVKDIMAFMLSTDVKPIVIIDLPRSMSKRYLNQLWSSVEVIADGYAWDSRYKFREKIYDAPVVWCFINTLPDLNSLSRDRWVFYQINEDYELVTFDPSDPFV